MTTFYSTVPHMGSVPTGKFWGQLVMENIGGVADDKVVLVEASDGTATTFKELREQAHRLALFLKEYFSLEQDDVVALICVNSARYAVLVLALELTGAVPTCLNPHLTASELEHCLALPGDKLKGVICSPGSTVSSSHTALEALHLAGGVLMWEITNEAWAAATTSKANAELGPLPELRGDPKEKCAIIFSSSGTTGKPKGESRKRAYQFQAGWPEFFNSSCTNTNVLPLFHAYGSMCCILGGLLFGAKFVHFERFRIDTFTKAIREHQATHLTIVPPIAVALVDQHKQSASTLASIQGCMVGSAPLKRELALELLEAMPNASIIQSYGMTEMAPATHMLPQKDSTRECLLSGTAGRLLPGMEARLALDDGTPVSDGTVPGELFLRGPNRMLGYLGNAKATQEAIDKDGWLRTGDIFTVDQDGCWWYVGRSKEIIRVNCFQVSPVELEECLLESDEVLDCAVVAQADPRKETEVPIGFVVLRDAHKQPESILDDLLQSANSRLVRYKRMARLIAIDAIPRSAAGKVLRTRLAASQDVRLPSMAAPAPAAHSATIAAA
ncbi:acetyl-CoA synthetase-like protein [Ceraceosorus guamensis]|uniref:Acetyl-CoA synthetase-like protein n=1 Tax=Ceraceosorus guamensis TaxID=1522189 RepID=A0A316VPH2_9BASI|nr:acetyl-CoA synthetase-like protein [Ceraceosorus guamensis]PWN39184.1 acetyl-CoA synthetase-like protein [Ceraceosorus guamensis]